MAATTLKALLLLSPALASAQTFTSCDPLKETCPPDLALGKAISYDFTKGASPDWTLSTGAFPTFETAGDTPGAKFAIAKTLDSPTMSSKWFLMFGHYDAVLRTAPGVGVISSLVLQSDDLDEIDFEWLGADNQQVQTNYFGKGNTTTYDRGGFHPNPRNQDEFHTYSIDWTSEKITWAIDGKVIRTLTPQTAQANSYPQSPMQIKIGTWPSGDPSEPAGVIQWGGGPIDYKKGPFVMTLKSLKAVDYSTGKTYVYGDRSGSWQSIKADGGKINPTGNPNAAAEAAPMGSGTALANNASAPAINASAPIANASAPAAPTGLNASGSFTNKTCTSKARMGLNTRIHNATTAVAGGPGGPSSTPKAAGGGDAPPHTNKKKKGKCTAAHETLSYDAPAAAPTVYPNATATGGLGGLPAPKSGAAGPAGVGSMAAAPTGPAYVPADGPVRAGPVGAGGAGPVSVAAGASPPAAAAASAAAGGAGPIGAGAGAGPSSLTVVPVGGAGAGGAGPASAAAGPSSAAVAAGAGAGGAGPASAAAGPSSAAAVPSAGAGAGGAGPAGAGAGPASAGAGAAGAGPASAGAGCTTTTTTITPTVTVTLGRGGANGTNATYVAPAAPGGATTPPVTSNAAAAAGAAKPTEAGPVVLTAADAARRASSGLPGTGAANGTGLPARSGSAGVVSKAYASIVPKISKAGAGQERVVPWPARVLMAAYAGLEQFLQGGVGR